MDMVVSACSFFIYPPAVFTFPWKLQFHCVQLSSIQALGSLAVSSDNKGSLLVWSWVYLSSSLQWCFCFPWGRFPVRSPHQAWSWGVWRGPFTRYGLPGGDSGGWWQLQCSVMKLSLGHRYWWKKFSHQILRSSVHLHGSSRRDQDVQCYSCTASKSCMHAWTRVDTTIQAEIWWSWFGWLAHDCWRHSSWGDKVEWSVLTQFSLSCGSQRMLCKYKKLSISSKGWSLIVMLIFPRSSTDGG